MAEFIIHAATPASLDVGGGNPPVINAETYGGTIPYPPILLDVDDILTVRLVNDLPDHATGIHWHGIELENCADGTEVTQNEVPGGIVQQLGNGVDAGGTFLYQFKVPRPGIFWFHPHHHHSPNRVFRGQYGMIVVSEPAVEAALASVLPANLHRLALSDITVCKAPGANDAATYVDPSTISAADRPEWLSNLNAQNGPTPAQLCEAPTAIDDMGHPVGAGGPDFQAGEIPNHFNHTAGTHVEGQTVLTNGVNVGGRKGKPDNQGDPDMGFLSISAHPGEGLRFQIANMATTRYFRLRLMADGNVHIPLYKVGGEGGILNDAVLEGGMLGAYDTKYEQGEILLGPGSRADVVAVIPQSAAGTVVTMWTRDFQRLGGGNWAGLPTVPVLHIVVDTNPVATFPFGAGTALKSITGSTPALSGAIPVPFLDPTTFGKAGAPNPTIPTQEIALSANPGGPNGINGVAGSFDLMPYITNPHIDSTRYTEAGNVIEFRVRNESGALHPFHLHGFSFHPVKLETNGGTLLHTWPTTATEFRDNFDVPGGHTITFRAEISPRPLADGVTGGGAYGRWLFHCHIFFHAHHGMISELVVTDANGREKPNVNVNGSWAYAPVGGTATRTGTYFHPDGDTITLSTTFGTVNDLGGGQWDWNGTSAVAQTLYVYVKGTDSVPLSDQAVFRVKFGEPDDGSDVGDPHIHTVDGTNYDFQAAGEFVLLRDRDGMEIQSRQTPVLTGGAITDPHSGLITCVSLNTAVAARVGSHRIAYQPGREGRLLQFYLDGKPAQLTPEGIDLDGHRVSAFDVNGAIGLRVDYAHHAVLTVAPHFWAHHSLWYMNIAVSHTHADEGLMGIVPKDSWLPRLPTGMSVGQMPQVLHDRYVTLYKTFANAWRVTDRTSLFVYEQGMSTATFTDEDWPAETPPCELKPQFETGAPIAPGISLEKAEQVCKLVTIDELHRDCVFDVATTGDEGFAAGYLLAQELKLRGSAVQIAADKQPDESLLLTATVLPIRNGGATPTGSVTFLIDGAAAGPPVALDAQGIATLTAHGLAAGEHGVRAVYAPADGKDGYHPSSSPTLLLSVAESPKGAAGPQPHPWSRWHWLVLIIVLVIVAAIVWRLWLAP